MIGTIGKTCQFDSNLNAAFTNLHILGSLLQVVDFPNISEYSFMKG